MEARTILLTALSLIAFAANSILCRLALRPGLIDAASFAAVRLTTGALVLLWIGRGRRAEGWKSGLALAAYALPFSFAYLRLDASSGALVLFTAVQLTMFGTSLVKGDRPSRGEWLGLVLAAGGFVALAAPGASAPEPLGVFTMACAGAAWGAYSLLGRGVADPRAATARNFLLAAPLGIAFAVAELGAGHAHATSAGLGLAVASGLASGIPYVVWYTALRGLTAAQAGVAQLSVPVLAALGGVALLGEQPSQRLVISGVVILGGVALALSARRKR